MSFSLQPCFLRDWELQVHFKIHGQGKKNLHGDGLAIWYTKDRMQPGIGTVGCCGKGVTGLPDSDSSLPSAWCLRVSTGTESS